MKKYPSIEQFRHVIKAVRMNHDFKGVDDEGKSIYQHTENYPTLKFQGTVKLHGSNASIVKYSDGRIEFQSRSRVLSLEQDNSDFMKEMSDRDFNFLFKGAKFDDYIAVYGEWCGGNIQKGVAINGLPKMFVIFGVKVDDEWVTLPSNLYDSSQRIYNILQFPTYEIDINFNNPEEVQNKIIDMTLAVEERCPVGEHFGVKGVGEGIVFTCMTDQKYKFKSKGEKHSATKVKKLNPIDTEEMGNINELVESVVTESRLEQGISFLRENNLDPEPENTGQFLGWVVRDVLKEETDTIQANGLNEKKVKNAIVMKARGWFLNRI